MSLSRLKMSLKKGSKGLLKKNGTKCKQSELKTEEMEVNEVKVLEVVGVVKCSEPEACTEGQDEDESVK